MILEVGKWGLLSLFGKHIITLAEGLVVLLIEMMGLTVT